MRSGYSSLFLPVWQRHGAVVCGLLCGLLLWQGWAGTAVARQAGGFFRAAGTEILDPDGQPVVLRGVGLGGWLMPEGYMLHIPGFGSPSDIRAKIEDLIGPEDTDRFFEIYEANYVAEADVAAIADWGFDHIRLPFHYRVFYDPDTDTFREEGFALLDQFLAWCKTYGLYVILDMHAAPGAQSEGNIADSDGVARLWTEPDPYQDLTVAIWTEIARRYANETQIIGYDLINEPVTPDEIADGAQALRDLYERLAGAIRTVDPNHILFIEGNYYATTFDKLFPPFDDNMVYAFHKYWNETNQGTIQYLLDLRDTYQVPLWLGETGENSNPWIHETIRLVEGHGIGWNFWTHKKVEAVTSPLSAPLSPNYQTLLDYWNGQGPRPDPISAKNALFEQAANLLYERCRLQPGVLRALFDPDFAALNEPFKTLVLPGVIDAVDYNLGGQGKAYFDVDYKAVSGAPGGGNTGGKYRNDGVDIESSTDPLGGPYNVGWIETREWLAYTVEVQTAGRYEVAIRVASLNGGGKLALLLDGERIVDSVPVPKTGGWQTWTTLTLPEVELPQGTHELRLSFAPGGFNVNRMTFTLLEPTPVEREDGPGETRLLGVAPNPTRGDMVVRFEVPAAAQARLEVFDMLGRQVARTPWRAFSAGAGYLDHVLHQAPGTYFVRLTVRQGSRHRVFVRPVQLIR
ncbi:MAG: carbohydrate-binding protein [Bacteroidetes bacterium]|nr:MAG: carbohydrate-binding protein [Bacteroidota bacterium]